jgi:membrane-bound lytic murein transglycosylase D
VTGAPVHRASAGDRPGLPRGFASPDRLDRARDAYFQGVRAFVREDLDGAHSLFAGCREAVGDPSAYAADGDRRDAGMLASKSEYFLERIEAARGVPELAGLEPLAEEDAAAPGWEVRHGSIAAFRNDDVERWLDYFQGDGRTFFQKWLDRQSLYTEIFEEVFAEKGLPPELTYHAMIESGYSTSAYSWAHAAGLWQFIRSTGRKYGLRCDWWVDERRDPVKSTRAAAEYLTELYEEFQDWELALAAYNVGEHKIRKQIDSQKTRDFWKLKLPRETRNHVPKFYAALIIGSSPEEHGFERRTATRPPSETIRVGFSVDFDVLGDCCGVPAATLAELNPALLRRATPPDDDGYAVHVPAGTGERALAALEALPEERRIQWAHHRVQGGDTLSEIADRYRTSVYAISEANRLSNVHRLRIGQELLIPQGQRSAVSPPSFATSDPGPTTGRQLTYVVRKGDTLSEIAERHGVSSSRLRSWNRLGTYIYPGQKLTIYQGSGGSSSSPSSSSSSGSTTVVQVRKGDTLWDIARAHGVSLTALLSANGLSKRSLIRPGDRIRVPRS